MFVSPGRGNLAVGRGKSTPETVALPSAHSSRYFEATSALPSAPCPAARRAVSTLNGEHDT